MERGHLHTALSQRALFRVLPYKPKETSRRTMDWIARGHLVRTDQTAPPPARMRETVALGQGEVFLAKKPAAVKTVLGSCVAVIFHVPRLKISSLCHALLPEPHGDGRCRDLCPRPCSLQQSEFGNLKYVTCCIRKMLDGLRQLGIRRKEVITTLVGGANVLEALDQRWSVADRNVAVAIATLERQGLPIKYMDVGGNEGRTIEHLSDVNRTTVRYHRSTL